MALQTDYRDIQPAAVAGAQATMRRASIISRNVETAAGIPFGRAVSQGAADKGIVLTGTGATKIVGISLLDRSATGSATTPDAFRQRESARVMEEGDIWVVAAAAVAAQDPVFVTGAGAFTNVETNNIAFPGARWETSTTAAGQLAVVVLG